MVRNWFTVVTEGEHLSAVSTRIGVSVVTIRRWLRDGRIPADMVIVIAREYGADPLYGLLRCGYFEPAEFSDVLRFAVRRAPTVELSEELHRRVCESTKRTRNLSVRSANG